MNRSKINIKSGYASVRGAGHMANMDNEVDFYQADDDFLSNRIS